MRRQAAADQSGVEPPHSKKKLLLTNLISIRTREILTSTEKYFLPTSASDGYQISFALAAQGTNPRQMQFGMRLAF
jgi:hypothetical protein